MAKRKLSGISKVERMFKIWEYLKFNTDKEHTTTPGKMRKDETISEWMGDKETFNRLIKDMANIMNSAEYGYKDKKDWKIVFKDFERRYGIEVEWELDEQNESESVNDELSYMDIPMRIQDLYYNQPFSYEEVNGIIEGILNAKTLGTVETQTLIKKVEENLTTKFYKKGPKCICKVCESELVDREILRNNLLLIQEAIDHKVQIAFRFNRYSYQKKLEPVRQTKDVVTPYYIVVNAGKYYLLACKERVVQGETKLNMSIWRIDLMTEMEIPGKNEKLGQTGQKGIPKNKVENLPMEWTEDFQLKHLNMSYDRPIMITLRIKNMDADKNDATQNKVNYTFLHDWFGNSFHYIKTEEEVPYGDIVKVECSPYAMTHWALQYSDRVEVIAPESVRDAVKNKIKALNEKYGVK